MAKFCDNLFKIKNVKIICLTLIFIILSTVITFSNINTPVPDGFKLAKIDQAWEQGITGKGVKVAIIDTGFTDLPGLDFVEVIEFKPVSSLSHGTATASILRQIAPDADIYALAHGGTWSGINSALNWCLDNNVDVINMSIGGKSYNSYMSPIELLHKKGVVMIASAGNYDIEEYYPAYIDGVYSIGGVRVKHNEIIDLKYNNQKWNDFIFEAYRLEVYDELGYKRLFSGTSASSPCVAGIFALLKQEYPNASKNELYNLLVEDSITVKELNGVYPVYPIKEHKPKPDPKPEIDNMDRIFNSFKNFMKDNNKERNAKLVTIMMEISEIKNKNDRQYWFEKVLEEM